MDLYKNSESKVKAGGILHNVIVNEIARHQGKVLSEKNSSAQLDRYKKFLINVMGKAKTPILKSLITKEINFIKSG